MVTDTFVLWESNFCVWPPALGSSLVHILATLRMYLRLGVAPTYGPRSLLGSYLSKLHPPHFFLKIYFI